MQTPAECGSRPVSRMVSVVLTLLLCLVFYFLVTVDYILDSEDMFYTHFLGAVALSLLRVLPYVLCVMYAYLFSEGICIEFLWGMRGGIGRSLISIAASVSVLAIASVLFIPWALIVLYFVHGHLH